MDEVRKGLLLCLFVMLSSALYGQLLIGPKVGFQVAKVIYEDKAYAKDYQTLFKPGYNVGLVLNYKANSTFSLHTELFYSIKGKTEKRERNNIKNMVSYRYLDLPLMLRISHHGKIKKQNVEFYFNIGPSFGYWLGGKGKLTSGELEEYMGTDHMKYTIKFSDGEDYGKTLYVPEPNRLQIELNFGGGVVFDMARRQKLMIDFRYGLGIGQTFLGKKEGGDFGLVTYIDNFEAVNHVISLSAAYLFEFNLMQMLQKGKSVK